MTVYIAIRNKYTGAYNIFHSEDYQEKAYYKFMNENQNQKTLSELRKHSLLSQKFFTSTLSKFVRPFKIFLNWFRVHEELVNLSLEG